MPRVAPWQVWWADFNLQVGHEQAGLRPSVVVGTEFSCAIPNGLLFVVPCTTTDRDLPYQPRLDRLNQPSFAMCDQLRSISEHRLRRLHPAQLADTEIADIKFSLRGLIDILP